MEQEHVQPFRVVYKTGFSAPEEASHSEVVYISCHWDPSVGKDIVLWDDILVPFKEALYVRNGARIIPFVKGADFKNLDPLRIAAVLDTVLDVVVEGQSAQSETSLSNWASSVQTGTPPIRSPLVAAAAPIRSPSIAFAATMRSPSVVVAAPPRPSSVASPRQTLLGAIYHESMPEATYQESMPEATYQESIPEATYEETEFDDMSWKESSPVAAASHSSGIEPSGAVDWELTSTAVSHQSSSTMAIPSRSHGAKYSEAPSEPATTIEESPSVPVAQLDQQSSSAALPRQILTRTVSQLSLAGVISKRISSETTNQRVPLKDEPQESSAGVVPQVSSSGVASQPAGKAPRPTLPTPKVAPKQALSTHVETLQPGFEPSPSNLTYNLKPWLSFASKDIPSISNRRGNTTNTTTVAPSVPPANANHRTQFPDDAKTLVDTPVPAVKLTGPSRKDEKMHPDVAFGRGKAVYESAKAPKDYEAAKDWFALAAKGGRAEAVFRLGEMYDNGQGVDVDYPKAVEYYRKAAKQGHMQAQFRLGEMYDSGFGVVQDYVQAEQWYQQAAEQGHAIAQFTLGCLYDDGEEGVEQDYALALKWYKEASNQDVAAAQYNLGHMYASGNGVEQDYKLAMAYYLDAADQGHQDALYQIGYMYDCGQGVREDPVQALDWYKKVAKLGDAECQLRVGTWYEVGRGTRKNRTHATKWYAMAAEQGNKEAQQKLDALLAELGRDEAPHLDQPPPKRHKAHVPLAPLASKRT
ncbi:hypothetical protein BGX29_005482 [Mortierella sp. GBA35]|nr:hypothetical protein BGX29_005482 [Mortierella sp. GBA35]